MALWKVFKCNQLGPCAWSVIVEKGGVVLCCLVPGHKCIICFMSFCAERSADQCYESESQLSDIQIVGYKTKAGDKKMLKRGAEVKR